MNLAELSIGSKAMVIQITAKGAFNRRVRDLGIVPGAEIIVENRAPFGDPISIRCKGMCLALRLAEAEQIIVEEMVVEGVDVHEQEKNYHSSRR